MDGGVRASRLAAARAALAAEEAAFARRLQLVSSEMAGAKGTLTAALGAKVAARQADAERKKLELHAAWEAAVYAPLQARTLHSSTQLSGEEAHSASQRVVDPTKAAQREADAERALGISLGVDAPPSAADAQRVAPGIYSHVKDVTTFARWTDDEGRDVGYAHRGEPPRLHPHKSSGVDAPGPAHAVRRGAVPPPDVIPGNSWDDARGRLQPSDATRRGGNDVGAVVAHDFVPPRAADRREFVRPPAAPPLPPGWVAGVVTSGGAPGAEREERPSRRAVAPPAPRTVASGRRSITAPWACSGAVSAARPRGVRLAQ